MAENRGFTVKITKEERVKAAVPAAQNHWLPLSNLDMVFPPVQIGVFFCYHRVNATKEIMEIMNFEWMLHVMKNALSETLVSYFPYAGEIVENRDGEPELFCNNGGVEFVEAYADVELRELDLHKIDDSIGRMTSRTKHGVGAIQATELKCGSIVVTFLFDHRVSDAHTALMFMMSWTEYARTNTMSVRPTFRRSLLNPRFPPQTNRPMPVIRPRARQPVEEPQQHDHNDDDPLEGRMYYMKASKIQKLRSLCCSDGIHNTKFEAFVAYLWKLIAKSCEGDDAVIPHIGIVIDGRTKLSSSSDHEMMTYFGNVISCPLKGHKVKDLIVNPLTWVANEVHQVIEQAATKDHFMDLIDHIESHRPNPIIYSVLGIDELTVVVSSGLQLDLGKLDFGWGSPVLGSAYFPYFGNKSGYVMPLMAITANGDWVVYMTLKKRQLDMIEKDAAETLVPLTTHHLLPRARY